MEYLRNRIVADKAWKAFERRIAAVFGGKRRGADTRDERGGKTDVIHPYWAIECKLLGAPTFSAMKNACIQAETNAAENQEPVAIIKRKSQGSSDDDALVVMRLGTFKEWRL